jgi:hypothetical protein
MAYSFSQSVVIIASLSGNEFLNERVIPFASASGLEEGKYI